MIEVEAHIVLVALHDLLGKLWGEAHRRRIVAETVTLLVRLRDEVQTILVAEVVPARVVGIVACAHGIDVEPLHQLDILYHALAAHIVAPVGVHLVAVGSLEEYRLAVDEHLRVLDFYLPESHLLRNHLHHTVTLLDSSHESEEIGSLSRPPLHIAHREANIAEAVFLKVGRSLGHRHAIGVEQLQVHHRASLHVHLHLQRTVLVAIGQVGGDAYIVHMHLLVTGIEITLACHAAEPPEVLILRVAAVAPAETLEGNEVVSGLHIGSDIKLGSHLRVFRIAHKLSVHIEVDIGSDRTEVGDDLPSVPVGRQLDYTAVRAHMVVLVGHIGWIVLEVPTPRKPHIHIHRVAISVKFPVGRHIECLPGRIVQIGLVEICRPLVGILYKLKLPRALERQVVGRPVHVPGQRLVQRFVCEKSGMHREPVHLIHLLVLPLRVGGDSHIGSRGSHGNGCGHHQKSLFHVNRIMLVINISFILAKVAKISVTLQQIMLRNE